MHVNSKIEKSHQILNNAIRQYKPTTIVLMTSWGHDSQVSTELTYRWAKQHAHSANVVVVTLDTGVSADGYAEWAKKQSRGRYGRFEVWSNADVGFQWYKQNALKYGFGYTRIHHTNFYYRMLKERTIAKILKHYKKHRHEHVIFVSGVYQAESNERATAPEIQKINSAVWVNPILYWQKPELEYYRQLHNLPDNPFYKTVGGSGDCQCNWGAFVTLDELKRHSPNLAQKIDAINNDVIKKHGYGWGQKPSAGLIAENNGQLTLPGIEPLCSPNLCAGCERPKPKAQDALSDYLLDQINWTE